MKISKRDEAKIIANQLALVGSPRNRRSAPSPFKQARTNKYLRPRSQGQTTSTQNGFCGARWDVRRVHKIESLGPVSVPA
jgi:hypothetical protein